MLPMTNAQTLRSSARALAAAGAALLLLAVPARAVVPGSNGVIGYQVSTGKNGINTPVFSVGSEGTAPQRLTPAHGKFLTPEFSPDGKKIAYSHGTGNKPFQIYVADADGSSPKRITNGEFAISPSWSPDSKHVVYQTLNGPQPESDEGPFPAIRLHVVGANGKGDREIEVNNIAKHSDLNDPVFSPNGKTVVASLGTPRKREYSLSLVKVKAKGGRMIKLTGTGGGDEANPSVSPDGRSIVYEVAKSLGGTQSDIAVMPIKGGSGRRLTTTPVHETNPVWSPDGERIALTSDRDNVAFNKGERSGRGFELYTMAVDGTDFVRLTDDRVPTLFPDWQSLP